MRYMLTSLLIAAAPGAAQTTGPAAATNALGLDLYRLEAAKGQGNLLLSPYSIQAALCMALGGADGGTKAEMAKVLHLTKPDAAPGEQAELRAALEKAAADSGQMAELAKKHGRKFQPLQLRVANRLFGREGYPFHPDFLQRMQTDWQAPLEMAAFAKSPERARVRINRWVEQQTQERIEELIPANGVNKDTRLVLVNAIYFKAAWAAEFREAMTQPLPFHAGGTTEVNAPTMYQQHNFGYLKEAGYAAVTVPYTGYALQLLILLPEARDGLAALEKKLTAEQLAKLSKASMAKEVQLYLPKFKLTPPTLPLGDDLKLLGMKSAFDEPAGSADFSRMAPRTPEEYLRISQVFHKTFLALDEKGTEAAAATAAEATVGASATEPEKPKPVKVRVDHPFLFAIQHRDSGLCLFLGRVTDPR